MLVTNDLNGLKNVTEQQREKLIESQLLNREREELICAIKESHEIEGDVTLSRLLDVMDDQQASRLTQLRELILNLNSKIIDTRNTNALLLNQSREFISKTMTMLAKINNPDNNYQRSGLAEKNGREILVDRRI
jgi:hypothetical protein